MTHSSVSWPACTTAARRAVAPRMSPILQAARQRPDQDAALAVATGRAWQLVLGFLDLPDDQDVPFGQTALFDFRLRLNAHDMGRHLVERTQPPLREQLETRWGNEVDVRRYPLRGTVRYPTPRVLRLGRPPVSRVREVRTHGLKGGSSLSPDPTTSWRKGGVYR